MYDVTIVGGGVVGMTLAAELARSTPSLSVLLLDAEPGRTPMSSGSALSAVRSLPEPDLRTFAITPSSAKSFGPAWTNMLDARATAFNEMQVIPGCTAGGVALAPLRLWKWCPS